MGWQRSWRVKMQNPYLPKRAKIEKIVMENEARDLRTFRLSFPDGDGFSFDCGQFAEITVPGWGEAPFGIASSPLDKEFIEFTVKRYPTGTLTRALHNCREGEIIGVRGPYGNSYPLETMKGMHAVIISGGFAFTTLRSTIKYLLHKQNRSDYKKITVIYGARSPGELLYKDELKEWEDRNDIDIYITVDKGDETWQGREGFVPTIVKEVAPSSENAMTLVCGPPIMLKFTIPVLRELKFEPDKLITSLEMRMKCGIGKCGRCNIGSQYVCKDGPVFSYAQLQTMPGEY